jgi:hypothetical protein
MGPSLKGSEPPLHVESSPTATCRTLPCFKRGSGPLLHVERKHVEQWAFQPQLRSFQGGYNPPSHVELKATHNSNCPKEVPWFKTTGLFFGYGLYQSGGASLPPQLKES